MNTLYQSVQFKAELAVRQALADEKKPSIMDTLKAKKEEALQNVTPPAGKMKSAEMEI